MSTVTIRIVETETIVMNLETNEIISSTKTREVQNEAGVPAVKAKATKAKKEKVVKEDTMRVSLEDLKLVLTPGIVSKLGAEVGDRIAINYVNDNGEFSPVISKSSVYGDDSAGNKLTKSLTVSFKGKQRDQLSQFGSNFELVESSTLPEGVFFVKDNESSVLEVIKEDELITVDAKEAEVKAESFMSKFEEEPLEDSDKTPNFDWSFSTNEE